MKKIKKIALIGIAFLSLVSCAKKTEAAAGALDNSLENLQKRGVFVLGLDDPFPPLGFRSETNEIVGYDIDLAKEVAARLKVKFKAQPIQWDAKEQELNTGKIDCIWNGFTVTPERKKALAFTKPYLNNRQIVIVRKDSGIVSLLDLAGKKAGVQSGSNAQDAIDSSEHFKSSLKSIVMFKDNITALNDLEIKQIDAVVMDEVVGNYSITTTKKPFVSLDEGLSAEEYGIGFRKNDVKLRDKVQKILEEMQKDGTVTAISVKWFGKDISVIGR
ncbi:amino acid ABC transporter substrate-binding protein [Treponema parvum]|uniref:Amino acid ABC transporter substrate-binding protein n=1 Tax=Treponema parvum TaxID=138851 RepID=A0A975F4B8_9SPIR|nr:amino acid ABC transporter substrate-binding protein [Treponema parvum]QTQ14374.1 amino acid ABC transporter substrate-binding protein [Treponema parvum]